MSEVLARAAGPTQPPRPERTRRDVVAWGLLGGAVLAQVAYPLTPEDLLAALSIVVVLLAASAAVAHVAATLGAGPAVVFLVAVVALSLGAEAVGVATGWPFGDYRYTDSLGAKVLGVPLVVPLAWTMMSWPCLVAARRLVDGRAARAVVGACALAAWDLFLDPQLVDAGHWTWLDARVVVPGSPDIPVSNTVGWLLVGAVVVAVLDALLPEGPRDAGVPVAFLTWTWVGSTVASALFFGRPVTAVLGGVALGAVVVPLLRREALPPRRPEALHGRVRGLLARRR